MPGTLRESMALLTESYDKWDLIGTNFQNDLFNRQVNDDDRLPHYPYRDDGKLIWDAIEEWVEKYVDGFYDSNDDVEADPELQVCLAARKAVQTAGDRRCTAIEKSVLFETAVLHRTDCCNLLFHSNWGFSVVLSLWHDCCFMFTGGG